MHLGRQKRLTPRQITALQHQRREGALIKTLMRDYTLSKASVYRYLRDREAAPSTSREEPHQCGSLHPHSSVATPWSTAQAGV
jgi:hypothetical protein